MQVQELIALLPGPFRAALPRAGRVNDEDPAAISEPLLALLEVVVTLLDPVEQNLLDLDRWFDPQRAPEPFVEFLATWVSLGDLLSGARARLHQPPVSWRHLVAAAAHLEAMRGTKAGLLLFLEIATGLFGYEIDEAPLDPNTGRLLPAAFVVSAPKEALAFRRLIEAIIAREAPAATTHVLNFRGD